MIPPRRTRLCGTHFALVWLALSCQAAVAKDYFLTIGGGYSREGNQASLEANVIFFQQVLREEHAGPLSHTVFFADGFNSTADLQVEDTSLSDAPATELLSSLYSFRGPRPRVTYRNHQVPDIAGPIDPENIKAALLRTIRSLQSSDRLFVYVTAHGGSAKGKNRFNTTISCWDNRTISAREFSTWLDEVPETVPAILVMAQCYCGGFAHTIFSAADDRKGLSDRLRVGFFAQQHDLAAAGCRPDIDNDEEYSSYFWGALAGRSRTGTPITDVDLNGDGRISLAEAHAHAVIASNTIDIPLRTSEALLRVYSRIEGYDHRRNPETDRPDNSDSDAPTSNAPARMQGTIAQVISSARVDARVTVERLAAQLGFDLDDQVTQVFKRFEEVRNEDRAASRTGSRRGRSSGRRQLREEIEETWPELADRDQWRNSTLLRPGNQAAFLKELESLPSFESYESIRQQRAKEGARAEQSEVLQVKFQRLVNALEAAVLAENLARIATPDIVKRYNEMLSIEESFLSPDSKR